MSQTLEAFEVFKDGIRRSEGPITRKQRSAPSKPQPRPQYANAVEFSFREGSPLEVTVPTRSVADTVRALKRAARHLDRNRGTGPEVRVQISVEPVMVQQKSDGVPVVDANGEPVMVEARPRRSVVKFLGHQPYMLGRRISKAQAEARSAGAEAAADVLAARRPGTGQHRRRAAVTHAKASLRAALVRAVITRLRPWFPVSYLEPGS